MKRSLALLLTSALLLGGCAPLRAARSEAADSTEARMAQRIRINAHALQTMVEIYAEEAYGRYPGDLFILQEAARMGPRPYWRPLYNPVDTRLPAVVAGRQPVPGAVGYEYDPASRRYYIRTWDESGLPLRNVRDKPIVLSNH